MEKTYVSSSTIGRTPPYKGSLRKRLFLLSGRRRWDPFVWRCDPACFGIITLFSSNIENKSLQCLWFQLEGSYRCINTFIYNIGIAVAKPPQHKRKLFPPLSTEYQLDHQSFAQHLFQDFYSRLKILSILSFDILQEVLPVEHLHSRR